MRVQGSEYGGLRTLTGKRNKCGLPGISIGELEESFSIMSMENNTCVFDCFVHFVISLKNYESNTPVPKNIL